MNVNVKCPECDHQEPIEVELHVRGGDKNHINVETDITDEAMADLVQRFEAHAKVSH